MSEVRPVRAELELRDYVRVIRRRKWTVIVITGLVLVVGMAYTLAQTRIYQAQSSLVLEVPAASVALNPVSDTGNAVKPEQVETEAEVMRSRSMLRRITAKLGYEPVVKIKTAEGLPSVMIIARDPDPKTAAKTANDFLNAYVDARQRNIEAGLLNGQVSINRQISRLDSEVAANRRRITDLQFELAQSKGDFDRTQVLQAELDRLEELVDPANIVARQNELQSQADEIATKLALAQRGDNYTKNGALTPTAPAEPRPIRNAIIALAVGLLLGLAVAFLQDYFDDTLRTKEDLDIATGGIPVLGLIPNVPEWRDRGETLLESMTHPHSATAEAYRSLRANLEFAAIDHKIGIIHITSSTAGEGKTTTATNLAVSLANAGKRVVLIDCDLRRPRLHKFFEMDGTVGFTSVLKGEVDAQDAVQPVKGVEGLLVLPSGPIPPNPAELLSTQATRNLLESLATFADTVVVDSPPLLPVADSSILVGYVDATILVVTARSTSKRSLNRSLEMLAQLNAPLEGILFNGIGREAAYGYGYGYEYAYDESERAANGRSSAEATAGAKGKLKAFGRSDKDADEASADL